MLGANAIPFALFHIILSSCRRKSVEVGTSYKAKEASRGNGLAAFGDHVDIPSW
jgi:hypothetical protein